MSTQSYDDDRIEPGERTRDLAAQKLDVDAIYRTFAEELSRFIARLSGHAESPDVLHEVFLVVQRRLPEFRGDSSLKSWLFAIAIRVSAARRRKQRLRRLLWLEHEEELAPAEPIDEATPETLAEGRRATRTVHAVLDRLSERDRTLIVLFELEGLPAREIAVILGTSENGVWAGLHRARARFRKQFGALTEHEGRGS